LVIAAVAFFDGTGTSGFLGFNAAFLAAIRAWYFSRSMRLAAT
jgi:hypothetical protein